MDNITIPEQRPMPNPLRLDDFYLDIFEVKPYTLEERKQLKQCVVKKCNEGTLFDGFLVTDTGREFAVTHVYTGLMPPVIVTCKEVSYWKSPKKTNEKGGKNDD